MLINLLIDVSIFAIFLLLFLGFLHPISAITQDLGRHILTGQIIWQTHQIPKTNLFSYTYPNFPFINHHWFSEIIFYLVYRSAGYNGLLIVTAITILVAFGIIFFYSRQEKNTNIVSLLAISILSLLILFERTDVRPEIFSYLFLAIFMVILFANRTKQTKSIFLLSLIELLWTNVHIYFFIGVIVFVLFVLDAIIQAKGNIFSKEIRQLETVAVLTCLATGINPNGISGALYPLHVFSNYGYAIEENQNIFFLQSIMNNPIIPLFEITVVLVFITLFLTIKKTKSIDWLVAVTFTIIGAMAIRNLPLFVFATFIPFVRSLSYISNYAIKVVHIKAKLSMRLLVSTSLLVILLVTTWQIIVTISTKHTGLGVISGAKYAADFYLVNKIPGPVFNNFDIGSYLEYRIYPKQKVFVDGRPEAYPASFFTNMYEPMQEDQQVFSGVDRKYHFNSIFFTHTDQTPWAAMFIKSIINNSNWRIVYVDDMVVLLVKNIRENKTLIQRFGIDAQHVHITNLQTQNIDSLFQLAHFFNEAGWTDKELEMYKYILTVNPNNCNALYNTGIILQQQQSTQAFIYTNRYNLYCK